MKRFVCIIAASLALASCGDDAAEVDERNAEETARGEVLGGSISDDMLPLDSVTSQSPPREVEGSAGDGSDGASEDGDPSTDTDAQQQEEAESDPAPEPAPEPEIDAEE